MLKPKEWSIPPLSKGNRIKTWNKKKSRTLSTSTEFLVELMALGEPRIGQQGHPPRLTGLAIQQCGQIKPEKDRPEVIGAYQKWGFQIDEKMGRWWEEDIPHVGMFIRLNIKHANPSLAATNADVA